MNERPIRGSVLLLATRVEDLADYVRAAEKLGVDAVLGVEECAGYSAAADDAQASEAEPALPATTMPPALRLAFGQRESALEIVQFATQQPLAAIVPADEQAAPSAMRAASMLGMRCHTPKGADACLDKFSLRQKLRNSGLNPPLLGEAPAGEDFGVAAILDSGTMRVLGSVWRRSLAPPGRVEDPPLLDQSARLSPPPQAAFEVVLRAARAVGLSHGPIGAELRVARGEIWVLHLTAVVPAWWGQQLRFRIPLVDEDVSLQEVILRHALGLDIGRIYAAHSNERVIGDL